jgi:hypothetical protein
VAKSTGTDDDAAVAGRETPRGLGCRVVGGEAGIGERGDIRWFQCFIDLHDAAGRCLQVLGIPAVGVDARKRTGLAMHVVAGAAGPAQPAGDQRVDDDLVLLADVGHRGPDCMHPTGILVPDRVRQLHLRLLGPLALENVKISSAYTRTADLHHHIERPCRCRDRYLRHLQVLVVAGYLHGSHGAHRYCSFPIRVQCVTAIADSGTKAAVSAWSASG